MDAYVVVRRFQVGSEYGFGDMHPLYPWNHPLENLLKSFSAFCHCQVLSLWLLDCRNDSSSFRYPCFV